MRPLLVGEASPHGREPLDVLPLNSAGARLARILGMGAEEYLAAFDRANLFAAPPAPWSRPEARRRAFALAITKRVGPSRPLVLLGRRVAEAFGVAYEPFQRVAPGTLVLPHPSGLCRTWNDPAAREAARRAVLMVGVKCSR